MGILGDSNAGNYNLQKYAEEMVVIKNFHSAKRGAAVTAAKKRLKTAIILRWLHKVADEYDLDITPSLAKHIIVGWIDRGVSTRVLNEQFGRPDRTASEKSQDFGRVQEMIDKYRPHVLEEIAIQFQSVHLMSSNSKVGKP